MNHFLADASAVRGGKIYLDQEQADHMRKVLRLHEGDPLIVSDGADRDYYCEIEEITREGVIARILSSEESDSELPFSCILFQGIPKGEKMEWLIQKCVELGAAKIVPVEMRRCVVKIPEAKKESRRARWQKIAQGASEQSGRTRTAEVSMPLPLMDAVRGETLDKLFVLYENAEGVLKTQEVLNQIRSGESIGFVVGPEGGIDPEEMQELAQLPNTEVLSLGRRILRTETCGLTMMSLLMIRAELLREEEEH